MNRRPFIKALCTAVAAGTIAGCLDSEDGDADDSGNGDPADNESEDDDPGNDNASDDETADGNDTDNDSDGSEDTDDDNETDDGGDSNESEDDGAGNGDSNETDEGDSDEGNETDDGDDAGGEPADDPEVVIETLETDCAGAEGGGAIEGGAQENESEGGAQENESKGGGEDGEDGDTDRATIEATDEGATVRGTIGSPTPCYEARVVESEVEDGELRVRVGVEAEDTDLCMECLGAVEYEVTVAGEFERIVVEHERIEDDPTEVAEADLGD